MDKGVIKAIFTQEYDRMYKAVSPVTGEHEAMLLFDKLNESSDDIIISQQFHSATNAMFKIRNDVCSSDRECCAFIFTALRLGFAEIMCSVIEDSGYAEQDD